MTRTEIEAVVRGLSPAMRKALLWLPADGSWKDHRRGEGKNGGISSTSLSCLKERIIGDPRKAPAVLAKLADHKFNAGEKECGQIWRNCIYRLTPLGLTVRNHLKAPQEDQPC